MVLVSIIILTYTFAILLIVLPKVETKTQYLEEKIGKAALDKVLLVTKNMQTNLENFQINALQYHKTELQDLTDIFWSTIQTKYNQSRPENIGSILEARGKELKESLMLFYNTNKNIMTSDELKHAIINFVHIFRYDHGSGYFFIHEQTTVIEHPIYPEFKGINFANIEDKNGVKFVQTFYDLCRQNGSGIVHYQWKHAKTKAIEDKITYVFTFEPFNWIIGTSGSVKALQDTLKNEAISLVKTIRYGNNNYFFINDYDNKIIAHPFIKPGTDSSAVKDFKGHLIVPPMIKIARDKGEGFTRYWWNNNPDEAEPYEKLTFSKNFPNWKMVISTGTSIRDIQKEVDKQKSALIKQLRKIIQNTKIGKSGYLFIVNKQGIMVIHPNNNIEGKPTKNMKNPVTGLSIFDELSHAGDTHQPMYYKWDKPSDKGNYIYDKISWAEYIPQFQWYVASSVYTDELLETSRKLKQELIFLGFTILLLSFLLSFVFFRRLLKPITTLSTLASLVTKGDYSVRSQLKTSDEIGILAREFNTMVTTIEDNIHNLDQKVAEKTKAIAEQNMLFETLFYESSDGILLIRDGLFVDCNKSAHTMLHLDNKEDLLTLHPSAISPKTQPDGKNSKEKANEVMQIALEKGSHRFEWTHLRSDASETFLEVVLTRVFIQNDIFIHVVWRDINEKIAADADLQNAQERLARAQKMEAIGMMAGGVAHDLNNILSGIVSYPELLLLQLPESSTLRKPIEAIQESGQRAATIVADLLTIARGVANEKKSYDLNTLIDEYLRSPEHEKVQSLHPGRLCIENYQAKNAIISCSPVHIKKTVMNLVTNAIEAVKTNGTISISTSNTIVDTTENEERNIPPGEYVVLAVQDDGPGINDDDVNHIFEPFYSKKIMGISGTGLGLTVVWNTMEDHGGTIDVESNEKGTCFTLYFPTGPEIIPQQDSKKAEKLSTVKGEHILIVDDEPQLRDIASQILESLGYVISSVSSGESAVAFIEKNPVDLLVIDMIMAPGINGCQTYEKILRLYPQQKAIVVSGFSESGDVKAALNLGAWGFIKKPYSIEQLGHAVKKALRAKKNNTKS